LWDHFDETDDPSDDRIFDEGRVTVVTTALDARPVSTAKMPDDTLTPLLMAVTLAAMFAALLLHSPGIALAAGGAAAVVAGVWLWPEPERQVAR
jgi:hypothetical protein